MKRLDVTTGGPALYDITAAVCAAVQGSGVSEGLCVVFCAEAGAGLLLTTTRDGAAHQDIMDDLERMVPSRASYRFAGSPDAAAHTKAALTGPSLDLVVHGGRPLLGERQGVYLAEYSGAGKRRVYVQCL